MPGEYEPKDSRNVTGISGKGMGSPGGADQQEGAPRWGGDGEQADPAQQAQQPVDSIDGQQQAGTVHFTADAALNNIVAGQQSQSEGTGGMELGGEHYPMAERVREHMEVIGADGVHVGTVDKVEGHRIKLTRTDSGMGAHQGHHHYVSLGLVAGIDGDRVRLSANGDVAYGLEEEE